jgi:hypothetical protein
MALPESLSKPIFYLIYNLIRLGNGLRTPMLRRAVQPLAEEKRAAFDRLLNTAIERGNGLPIHYDLPYPKVDFLNYLCDWRGLVAHGSPLHELKTLEPIRKSQDTTEFGNRTQIFCSPDAIWAMWFAILDKDKFTLTNNACIRIGSGARREKYYHFALPRNKKEEPPFAEGMLYICRAEDFPARREIPILKFLGGEVEEWGSEQPIQPLAQITIAPSDFPFLQQIEFADSR